MYLLKTIVICFSDSQTSQDKPLSTNLSQDHTLGRGKTIGFGSVDWEENMGGGAWLAAALILAACALKEGRALEDRKATVVAFQAAGSPLHHAGIKKARSKTVETSSHAAGGKKKPLRFHSAASERFGKMLRALKTGTRRSSGPSFESIDTDRNGCITAGEFNQNAPAGPGAPAFEDVAGLDGNADCISEEDFNTWMTLPQGGPSFESIDTDRNGCITAGEFNQNAPAGGPSFQDVAGLDGNADCISKEELVKQLTTGSGGGTGAYGGACACVHAICASSRTQARNIHAHTHRLSDPTRETKPDPSESRGLDTPGYRKRALCHIIQSVWVCMRASERERVRRSDKQDLFLSLTLLRPPALLAQK